MPVAEKDRLLTPEETAARLRLRKQTLAAWRVAAKNLPFVRISRRRVAYRESAVEKFIAAREIGGSVED